jgi:serine/threonine protein kinase
VPPGTSRHISLTNPPQSTSESELRARVDRSLAPAYEIEREIGRGGAGIVYRARDTRLKRDVAIKLLPPDLAFRPDTRERFMREAETSARLNHPNIVQIYSVDEKDGLAYFVMALIEGQNLGDRVRMQGALPFRDIRRVMREVADALSYAHSHGVVHRDIKPDNILLEQQSGRAMVTDFGIARAATEGDSRLTATGTAIGTPAYMSPEQCAGDRELDGRSDLYSLGAVAYYMMTGQPPFSGPTTPVVMMKQVTEQVVRPSNLRAGVPADLERIVLRLLEKDPGNRFGEGSDVVTALDGAPVAAFAPSSYPTASSSPSVAPEFTYTGRYGTLRIPLGNRNQMLTGLENPYLTPRMIAIRSRLEARRQRREAKDRLREEREEREEGKPLPDRIRRFRRQFASYLGTTTFLFGINAVTQNGGHHFWWAIFPAMGMAMGLFSQVGSLWAAGARAGDIFGGGRALDAPPSQSLPQSAMPSLTAPATQQPDADSPGVSREVIIGPRGNVLKQAINDRRTVRSLVTRLSETEQKMLPDVKSTAAGLYDRIAALATALHRLDSEIGPERLPALDERIAKLEQSADSASDKDRMLRLLKKQREMLANLVESRDTLAEQYESAGLLLQNLTLDMLKMRSSGLQSTLEDVTSVTQEARSLSKEIGYVLAAADELRELDK